jgi:hypothetical protein
MFLIILFLLSITEVPLEMPLRQTRLRMSLCMITWKDEKQSITKSNGSNCKQHYLAENSLCFLLMLSSSVRPMP